MEMKKNLFYSLFWAIMLVSIGCSNEKKEYPAVEEETSSIIVKFLLQDEDGIERYSFHEGDNIIFRLDIKNNTDEDAILASPIYILGNDVFHVYSSKGVDFGKPYDELILPDISGTIIRSKSIVSFLCPWINNPDSSLLWKPNYLNYEIGKLRQLSKGNYYSDFTIRLDSNRIVNCKKSFIIK